MKNIVYTMDGAWSFFTENGKLMCTNPHKQVCESIMECVENDFDATVSNTGVIYVMNSKDNGVYLSRYNGKWEKECVLESKTDNICSKNITLINVNEWLNAFYVLNHNGKNYLFHHILGAKISPFIVLETNDTIKFSVASDDMKNIHVVFTDNGEILYRKFIWKEKQWSETTSVGSFNEEFINVFILINDEYNPIVVCCTKSDNKYNVYVGTDNKIITSLAKEVYPCLVNRNKNITCVFEYYGKILESEYKDGEWGSFKYLHNKNFNKAEFMKISGTIDFEMNNVNYFYTYGNKAGEGVFSDIYNSNLYWKEYIRKLKNPIDDNTIEKLSGVSQRDEKSISQEIKSIKKAIENDDTSKILIQIANRLSDMENILLKVVNIVTEINNKN